MENPSYIHPSHEPEAHEYYHQLIEADRKLISFMKIGSFSTVSALGMAGAIHVSDTFAEIVGSPEGFYAIAGISAIITTVSAGYSEKVSLAKTYFLNQAAEYYRFSQARMPEWLEKEFQSRSTDI